VITVFHRKDPIWHLIALLTWLVDFAERLIRACVLWEGSLSVQSARNSKEVFQDNDQEVRVKLEVMEVDRDDLFDGELCMTLEFQLCLQSVLIMRICSTSSRLISRQPSTGINPSAPPICLGQFPERDIPSKHIPCISGYAHSLQVEG
jgi:hypothetical protein